MTCNTDRAERPVEDLETDNEETNISSIVDRLGTQLNPQDAGNFISTTLKKLSTATIDDCRITRNSANALRLLLKKSSNIKTLPVDRSCFSESLREILRLVEPCDFEWITAVDEDSSEVGQRSQKEFQDSLVEKNDACIGLLAALFQHNEDLSIVNKHEDYLLLYTIVVFYYPSPWASDKAQIISKSLLSTVKNWSNDTLIRLIDRVIRPRLLNNNVNRHIQVTSETGRKSINAPSASNSGNGRYRPDFTNLDGPVWKKQVPEIGCVLKFLVSNEEDHINLSIDSIHQLWNIITPACLNMLDDIDPYYKMIGSEVLRLTLGRIDKQFLEKTCLLQVFFDAIMPMLLYLPPSVGPSISAKVLNMGYEAMEQLVMCQFPINDNTIQDGVERAKIIDVLFIDGIFHGALYAQQQVSVILVIIRHATRLVEMDGIYSLGHLKNLVNIIVPILSDPFINASPELLTATLALVSQVILICWPRIHVYRFSLLKGLLLAYRWIHSDILQDNISSSTLDGQDSVYNNSKQELESSIINTIILLKTALVHFDGNDFLFNSHIDKIKQSDIVYSDIHI